jgi:hypothetical protein
VPADVPVVARVCGELLAADLGQLARGVVIHLVLRGVVGAIGAV